MPLTFEPPSNPKEIPAWLVEQEERVARWVAAYVRRLATETAERYFATLTPTDAVTASGDMAVWNFITNSWDTFVMTELVDTFGAMYLTGGVQSFISAPTTGTLSPDLVASWTNIVNQDAITYTQNLTPVWRDTGQRLQDKLSSKVAQALIDGPDPRVLAEELRYISDEVGIRADLLARTELTRAYNGGALDGMQALGEFGPVEKTWTTGLDGRVRPTHRAAEGQTVRVDQPFDVGGYALMHPADPMGPLEETISCRCGMEWLFPGDTRPDGSVVTA